MQDYGLVSIITPTWACAAFIAETIKSIQAQTYQNWELIIQDDCSKDNTLEVVKPFVEADKRIKYECNPKNSGAAITRNNALRRAKGKWIAFLDSDDLWSEDKLEKQLTFMVKNGYHFSYTGYEEMDEDSNITGVRLSGPKHVTKLGMFSFCWPGCLTVMYDREHVGLLQIADIKKNNDYAMWLKVIKKADCYLLDECLARYRRGRKGSVSTHGYGTMIRWHYKLWHEAMGMNAVASLFWTGMNLVFGVYKKLHYVKKTLTDERKVEKELFKLLSVGLGNVDDSGIIDIQDDAWAQIYNIANRQGVSAICLDGVQRLSQKSNELNIEKRIKLQWIASAMKQEQIYKEQWQAAKALSLLYDENGLDTYVMKGFSLSRLYPNPEHRQYTDLDCFLIGRETKRCAYEVGNEIAAQNDLSVNCSYYKHSKIALSGQTVENHQFLLPVKGSGKAKKFERELREWIDDGHNEYICDSKLKATSSLFDAVFVLAHAQEHFLNEGIILRHICDWAMVLKAHAGKVDWDKWKCVCKEYGILSFGYAMSRLANRVCGVTIPFDCPKDDEADRRLLDDTLYRKTCNNSKRFKIQVRIDLVKNMFRNSWKFRLFSDTNFLMFCGRRVWGYLFDKDLD